MRRCPSASPLLPTLDPPQPRLWLPRTEYSTAASHDASIVFSDTGKCLDFHKGSQSSRTWWQWRYSRWLQTCLGHLPWVRPRRRSDYDLIYDPPRIPMKYCYPSFKMKKGRRWELDDLPQILPPPWIKVRIWTHVSPTLFIDHKKKNLIPTLINISSLASRAW